MVVVWVANTQDKIRVKHLQSGAKQVDLKDPMRTSLYPNNLKMQVSVRFVRL
ncbi:hypothetical protein VQ7734_02322 [Vibrio quintilis]|uniref:Uncharacterized protein n=1 Tax=Vibrio quintilis TaxID=1117707 RepID=A0A1M7YVH3_9VIBR|nr:hypothetical protein VQ7734_02322 [Vibrio quintilis]